MYDTLSNETNERWDEKSAVTSADLPKLALR